MLILCFDLAGENPHRQGSFTDQPCGSRPPSPGPEKGGQLTCMTPDPTR